MKLQLSKYQWVLFLVGIGLYLNTLSFQYALDDKLVITANQITKKGFEGIPLHFTHDAMDGFWAEQYNIPIEEYEGESMVSGGRYRPFTLATHALEYGLFGESPGISHFINALLYGLLSLLVYRFLRFFNPKEETWFSFAFLAALLYATHPLHVEVVANIKGRDELLSFVFAMLAMNIGIHAVNRQSRIELWVAGTLFLLSLLSKETTAPFLILFPLTLYFLGTNLKQLTVPVLAMAVPLGLYLALRMSVLGGTDLEPPGELMNNPFLNASGTEKYAVVLLTFFAYLKLLILPHPLTHDYYPFHLPFMSPEETYPQLTHPAALAGLVFGLGLLVWALIGLKKREPYLFGIWLFFGTLALVSNALFPVGVFMNERFMFIPSLGLIMVLVHIAQEKLPAKASGTVLMGLSLVFALLTVNRNYAWENDEALALADVETSAGSAKAHMAAGDALITKGKKANNAVEKNRYYQEAFTHLNASLKIYPGYFPPLDLLASLYFETGNYKASAEYYALCYRRKPGKPIFLSNVVVVGNKLITENKYEEALYAYKLALKENPNYVEALSKAAETEARYLNNPAGALVYLRKAMEVQPGNADIVQRTGIVTAMTGDYPEAIRILEESLRLDPDNSITLNNLGITYMQAGMQAKGQEYINRAKAAKQ
jgi:Tfp pilus assembly protein PilF